MLSQTTILLASYVVAKAIITVTVCIYMTYLPPGVNKGENILTYRPTHGVEVDLYAGDVGPQGHTSNLPSTLDNL